MKIKRETYNNGRNDFKAIYECEHCGHEFEGWGYADGNFFVNVIPNAQCRECGKNTLGETKEETEKRLGRHYII